MSYIGSTPTTQSFIAGTDYFNGNGSTVNFTLSRSVNSVNDIEVIVNNVEQIPSGYSVSGTTLTFSAAPSAGTSNVYVRYLSTTNLSLAIPAGTSATFNTITATTVNTTALTVTNDATINGVKVGEGGGSIATNTAVGASVLNANTTGANSVAVGASALAANTTGTNNTAVGYQALKVSTTGDYNVAVGADALKSNTTGGYNIAVGREAMATNTTGASNSALGYNALVLNTTGTNNVAVGYQSLYSNTTGAASTAVGYQAGYSQTTGGSCTFMGDVAGYATTGAANTFLGRGAGYFVTSGANNTILGRYNGNQDGLDIRTESNNIVLSDGDGNVRMHYRGSDASWKSLAIYNNTTGSAANMTVLSSGTIARSTSSLKYKRDVQDATHGLAEVLQLRPVTYKGKAASDGETVFGGLIAEEVHTAGLTEFVQYAEDGSPDALAYGNMVSLMVKAIQEQQALITALTTRITALEAK
jgi:hypothetical protein